MKVIIEYQSGEIEERKGFDWFNDVGNRIALHYEDAVVNSILEIPKRAIKEIKITEF